MVAPSNLALLLYALPIVLGQQFTDYIIPHWTLGLSEKCFSAVNTTVASCPGWLAENTGLRLSSFKILGAEELQTLCESTCQKDLSQLRNSIIASCTAPQDIMVPPDKIAYPATFIIDRIMFAAGMSCLKDSASGRYCDLIATEQMNQTGPPTASQNCSECAIGIQAKQLGSPFGYNSFAASSFAYTTSSCAANTYSYATPTSYALNSTSAGPRPTPSCASGKKYVMKEGDSCNSISVSENVSTDSLVTVNGLDAECDWMPRVGSSLCLPSSCNIYQLQPGDTCSSIMKATNVTLAQLLAWNPIISPGCTTLTRWVGRYICLSSSVGALPVKDGQTITTEAPVPSNTQGSSNTHCGQWYTIRTGDTCASISLAFTISLNDFYFLNSGVDKKTCNNLWLGFSYCVKPVGDIKTYTSAEIPKPTPSFDPPPDLPHAPGTIDGCDFYKNGFSDAAIADDPSFNSCVRWAVFSDITLTQFKRWNLGLKDVPDVACFVSSKYSYCVLKKDDMNDPLSIYTPPATQTTNTTTSGTPTGTTTATTATGTTA